MFEVLVNQFGFVLGSLLAIVGTGLYILRGRADTQNHVDRSNAEARNQEVQSGRDVTQAILKLADTLIETNRQAGIERQKTFEHLERMTGRIEGMTTALLNNTRTADTMKSVVADFGTQLDEFGARIQVLPQIKTDVEGLVRRSQDIQAGFNTALDARIGPLIVLMENVNRQSNLLSQQSLTIIDLLKDMSQKGPDPYEIVHTETD